MLKNLLRIIFLQVKFISNIRCNQTLHNLAARGNGFQRLTRLSTEQEDHAITVNSAKFAHNHFGICSSVFSRKISAVNVSAATRFAVQENLQATA